MSKYTIWGWVMVGMAVATDYFETGDPLLLFVLALGFCVVSMAMEEWRKEMGISK